MDGYVLVFVEAHVSHDAGYVSRDGKMLQAHRGAFGRSEKGLVVGE